LYVFCILCPGCVALFIIAPVFPERTQLPFQAPYYAGARGKAWNSQRKALPAHIHVGKRKAHGDWDCLKLHGCRPAPLEWRRDLLTQSVALSHFHH
jgi:hypothetical protein